LRQFLRMPTEKSLRRHIEYLKQREERRRRRLEAAANDGDANAAWDPSQKKLVVVRGEDLCQMDA
jgi:hypothetical protein